MKRSYLSPSNPHYFSLQESTNCHHWGLGGMQACKNNNEICSGLSCCMIDVAPNRHSVFFPHRKTTTTKKTANSFETSGHYKLFVFQINKQKKTAVQRLLLFLSFNM